MNSSRNLSVINPRALLLAANINRVFFIITLAMISLSAASAQETINSQSSSASQSRQEKSNSDVPEQRGSIMGRVISDDGLPLASATVLLIAKNPKPGAINAAGNTAGTDIEGKFQIDNLERGAYNIIAFAPGYVTADLTAYDGSRPIYRVGDTATIRMVKGGVITGAVTNANGEPVVAAPVRAVRVRDLDGRPVRETLQFTSSRPRQTDDRGIYRLYGLEPGAYVIAAGGKSSFSIRPTAFDGEAAIYYPATTRDAATEVVARGGQEITGIEIRYRSERGHIVSGTITGAFESGTPYNYATVITLWHAASMTAEATTFVVGNGNERGFSFEGVADGEYEIGAVRQSEREKIAAPFRHITIKGADVTGLQLALAPLGSIAGHLALVPLAGTERKDNCASKRKALSQEVVIIARRDNRVALKEQTRTGPASTFEVTPDAKGDFALRNVDAGRYQLEVGLPGRAWYARSITLTGATASGQSNQSNDVTRDGVALRLGERVAGINIVVAEGAASLHGRVIPVVENSPLPARMRVYLIPAERERADDALRFLVAHIKSDGAFTVSNIAPGRYRVFARTESVNESLETGDRPAVFDADARVRLRREAETANTTLEVKLCQRLADYVLRYTPLPLADKPTPK